MPIRERILKITRGMLKNKKRVILLLVFLFLVTVAYYHTHKAMPAGVDYLSMEYPVNDSDLEFLYDLTYLNENGEKVYEQKIFDKIFQLIEEAEEYILIDMFLFNSYTAKVDDSYRKLAAELTEKLIAKKTTKPEIKIDFITDPINSVYGGGVSLESVELQKAGVNLITTNLKPLRDSNYIYSAVWRTFIQWFGNSTSIGLIKHPFSGSAAKVSARTYLSLANLKANHRKVIVADNQGELLSIITSANPHNGSSAHSNLAILFRGRASEAVLETERGVAGMSGLKLAEIDIASSSSEIKNARITILSESKIKASILNELKIAKADDEVMLAQFYFSDRDIVKALLAASGRGVPIKIILDPNKDAFGYEKNGIPNRQVATELLKKSNNKIKLRWYDTHGEQFHSKMFVLKQAEKLTAILGSANLTRRNLDNLNLELDARIYVSLESEIAKNIDTYFKRIWENKKGTYTADYEKYKDESFFKKLLYRFQEKFGLSSF